MNQNVTASFGLSVLTVLFFAVALYQPDPPASAAVTGTAKATTPLPSPAPKIAEPVPTPPSTSPKVAAVRHPEPIAKKPVEAPRRVAKASAPSPVVQTVSARVVVPEVPSEPKGPFTQVRAGEALGQVARRVYGPSGSAESLWRANRDVLESADAPLRAGTLLRTP